MYIDLFNGNKYNTKSLADNGVIWNPDGSKVSNNNTDPVSKLYRGQSKFGGSRYLKYDHALGKMVVVETLRGEQNSDLGSTLLRFVAASLRRCKGMADTGKKAHMEYNMFFSSHGGGWYGFGGDKNKRGRRRLTNTNHGHVWEREKLFCLCVFSFCVVCAHS